MTRMLNVWLVCLGLLVPSVFGVGCGSDTCSNDTHCAGGKICYRGKCSDPSVLDAGSESTTEPPPTREAAQESAPTETTPDAAPEQAPEAVEETTPEPTAKVGLRKEGEACDPRRGGHPRDLCGSGLECAELEQTDPTSGAPQPTGVCLKACSKDKPDCPTGTLCTQTLDTKTRQGTGLYVCAKEVGEGEGCVNTAACKQGLTCIRFGTTGTFWICQKDCTQDSGACGSGQVCKAIDENSSQKICKPQVGVDATCSLYNDCNDKGLCIPSGQSLYPSTCQAKCGTVGTNCDNQTEVCRKLNTGDSACFKKAKNGEECRHGYTCTDTNSFCSDVSPGFYSVCRQRCNTDANCGPGEGCERTRGSQTRVCQPRLVTGSVMLGANICTADARALAFSSGGLSVCLHNCSNGTTAAPDKCGALTPGVLGGVLWAGSDAWTVGGKGLLSRSTDDGATWTRIGPPVQADFTGIAASGDGTVVLVSGQDGALLRSEDSGKTWEAVNQPDAAQPDLWDVALSWNGKIALAVGSKGTIWRSEDGGKTWKPVTPSPAVTENLHAVTFGQDKAGSGSVALIVGAKGTLLRSEDDGKTWSAIALTPAITDGLWGVTLLRDASATGLNALVVGEKGLVLESTDAGKTFARVDVSRTETLRDAVIAGASAWIVGDQGATLARGSGGTWTFAKASFSNDLHALAVNGSKAIAVGSLGQVLASGDGGKTWKATSSRFGRCLGLTSRGRPAGGACGILCDPKANGADCPPQLQSCRGLTLSGQTVHFCINGTTFEGPRKAGEPCSRSSFSPLHKRCAANHTCIRATDTEYRCARTCDLQKPDCPTGQKCIYSTALGQAFCGTEAPQGQGCDWSKAVYCPAGSICRNNPLQSTWTCEPTRTAKLHEHCYPGYNDCAPGLVCTGNPNAPYRRFCTKSCDPNQKDACDAGWECLGTSGGSGVCIEKCSGPDAQCTIPTLRCSKLVANGNHCI